MRLVLCIGWSLLIIVVGCGRDSAELKIRSQALSEWQAGVDSLADGDIELAQKRFSGARSLRPGDQVLVLWEAEALAQSGRLEDAIALLSTMIEEVEVGVMPEVYHNRLAYMARAGHNNQVVVAIAEGVRRGQVSASLVIDDEDFSELIREGSLGFLPRPRWEVSTRISHQPVLPNESFTVEYQIKGLSISLANAPLSVRSDGVAGLLVTKIVEEQSDSSKTLRFHLSARDSGTANLGSVQVTVGNRQQRLSPVRVEVKGGDDQDQSVAQPVEWVTPTMAESLSADGVGWVDGTLVVELQRGEEAHITTSGGVVAPVYQGELRRTGTTVFRCAVFGPEILRIRDGITIDIRNRRGDTRQVEVGTTR